MTRSKSAHVRRLRGALLSALEGSCRGVYQGRPFSTRFTTCLQVGGAQIARQIDYVDYATFERLTSPMEAP